MLLRTRRSLRSFDGGTGVSDKAVITPIRIAPDPLYPASARSLAFR